MKNPIFTFLIFCFFAMFLNAQPALEWDTRYNGPTANDYGKLVTVDNNGNVFVAGVSDGSSSPDWITIKYSATGDTLWTSRYNGTGNGDDQPLALKLDNQGNVYITGYTLTQYPTYTEREMLTIKYSNNGQILWSVIDPWPEKGMALNVDNYGNVYVGGGGYNYDSGCVIKYNNIGIKQWIKYIGNWQDPEIITFIEIDKYDKIVVIAQLDDQYSFDNFQVHELNPLNGDYLFKYDLDSGIAKGLVLNQINGDIYVFCNTNSQDKMYLYKYYNHIKIADWRYSHAGNTIKAVDFEMDKYNNSYTLCSKKDGSLYCQEISKINPNGDLVWTRNYNSNTFFDNIPVSLALTKITDTPDILTAGNISQGNITVMKVKNFNGDTLWTTTYDCGNNNPDVANAMIIDKCENIYITGSSSCDETSQDLKTIKYSTIEDLEIEASEDLPICQGDEITLSVPSCIGCTYLWSSGQTSSSITVSPPLTTNYVVTLTNSSMCQATSDPLLVTVNPMVTPTVSIIASTNNVCAGTKIDFTASPIHGGANPSFMWFVDGVMKQSGISNKYSSTNLQNGNLVSCTMVSTAECRTATSVTSNQIQMSIIPVLNSSISIAASQSDICTGETVTFTATPVNGGNTPVFKWYINNVLQQETTTVLVAQNLQNGSVVKVEMYSSETCVTPEKATSNSVSIIVNAFVTPSISITSSANSICEGQSVTFTAAPVNGGNTPVYNWYINNEIQAGHDATFSTTALANGSQVYCIMNSNAPCLTQASATSNFVSVAVNPLLTPKVVINASSNAILSCEQVTFTPTPTHGGLNPTYKWLVNGNIVSTVITFVTSTLTNGAQVQCFMTSSANCVTTPTVSSDIITMTVFPLPQPELKLRLDTISVTNYSGTQYSYTWYFNGTMISTQPTIICSTHGNGSYYVVVKLNNCTVTSNTIEFDCATSISATEDGNKFKLFPNPTDGIIKIEGEQLTSGTFHIELRNILGVLIANQKLNVGDMQLKTEFDLNNYPGGIYLIVISSDTFRKVYSINKFN